MVTTIDFTAHVYMHTLTRHSFRLTVGNSVHKLGKQ